MRILSTTIMAAVLAASAGVLAGCYVQPVGGGYGGYYAEPAPVYIAPAPVYIGPRPYWGGGWRGGGWRGGGWRGGHGHHWH